jgi:hypothetical protein
MDQQHHVKDDPADKKKYHVKENIGLKKRK